ncbi:calponin-like proteiny domain-containing protein [Pyrus ussuriensis x Pyrus communis]|uniref:Calponin-like proteiny domain-containing protein n=1 Tax=Pyrus ussuriensis x Pyrus communis TaxID=2448454 RepID=A0A5N5HX40_9ROSA|nr:calponin-like proteiny domain-containing protein [Pyrus ussuriensis x Pyrus communis]
MGAGFWEGFKLGGFQFRVGAVQDLQNVYNLDNREKVRQDEEAAAKEEQLKRQQSRKRDVEFRLEQVRTARGLAPVIQGKESTAVVESKSAAIFDPIKGLEDEGGDGKDGFKKNKKMKKEEAKPSVVTEEDDKYRSGYGVAVVSVARFSFNLFNPKPT